MIDVCHFPGENTVYILTVQPPYVLRTFPLLCPYYANINGKVYVFMTGMHVVYTS